MTESRSSRNPAERPCPDCDAQPALARRDFLRVTGAGVAVAAFGGQSLFAEDKPASSKEAPETLVKKLYDSMNKDQRKEVLSEQLHRCGAVVLHASAERDHHSRDHHERAPDESMEHHERHQRAGGKGEGREAEDEDAVDLDVAADGALYHAKKYKRGTFEMAHGMTGPLATHQIRQG